MKLVAACITSLLVYGGVFHFIHRPLTLDIIQEMFGVKEKVARQFPSPRFFILAGSNGRISHSAEVMEPILGLPCVNLSIAAGIGLDYLFEKWTDVFRSGDILYIPLEYDQYLANRDQVNAGPDCVLLIQRDPKLLLRFGATRTLRAFFYFDLPFLIQGVGEMALKKVGFARRSNIDTLTSRGDEKGHDSEKAREYVAFMREVEWHFPSAKSLSRPTYAKGIISGFIHDLQRRGVTVIGGLPTVFDDKPAGDDVVQALQDFYRIECGAGFLALSNRSQYPRADFYDTPYHLQESGQKRHSELLAKELLSQGLIKRPGR
jgi:hypothetical protein